MLQVSGGNKRTGARLLVDQLKVHGVRRIFCVPGESYLAVLDALIDCPEIEVTICRHEGGATMMAEAYGKLTGSPGIAFVTRGPGSTNGSSGLHVGRQDSTPMILFIGDVERASADREAFQEIDYRQMFAPLAKWVTRIVDPGRIPELVSRAFATAASGRAGPVVVSLPEDVLSELTSAPLARTYVTSTAVIGAADLQKVGERLHSAKRPMVIVGGSGWSIGAHANLRTFSEKWRLPVAVSFRCNDYFDNNHPNYAGNLGLGANPALLDAIRKSDLLLVIGARLDDVSTGGYTLIGVPTPEMPLIHIHPDPAEIGSLYQPEFGLVAGSDAAIRDLASLAAPSRLPLRASELHAAYQAWTAPRETVGDVQMGAIIAWLASHLPPDAIITNGAGNFAIWPNRFFPYRSFRTMLAPTSGSMGYGLPAAVAAKLVHPERTVVCFTGDGDFLMTSQELAVAAGARLPIIIVLLNNGMFGTIRMHQERQFPGRVSATSLHNPDFAGLAAAYGANSARITRTEEFFPAFEHALTVDRPSLLEIVMSPEVISPSETIGSLRQAAQQRFSPSLQ